MNFIPPKVSLFSKAIYLLFHPIFCFICFNRARRPTAALAMMAGLRAKTSGDLMFIGGWWHGMPESVCVQNVQ